MKPTQEQRREAVRLARAVGDGTVLEHDQVVLVCATLLAAQKAFAERLAPVYAAAMEAVEADGRLGTWDAVTKFQCAVMAARAKEKADG